MIQQQRMQTSRLRPTNSPSFRRFLLFLALAAAGVRSAPAQKTVWTAQYNNDRTGANIYESILTTSNVNTKQFGLLFSRQVDGVIYAQPLFVPAVTIGVSTSNVVYVATMNNSVYAFDADNPSNSVPLWRVNFGAPLQIPPGEVYLGNQIGIMGTPVIDATNGTMYVVALTVAGGLNTYSLHALDITNGQEKFNGPVVIQGYVPGTASDGRNGLLAFLAGNVLQRPALTLYQSKVLVAFGALSDSYFYHGWIISYNAATLKQTSIVCTTPNGSKGGVWMSGVGIATDSNGIYFIVGDGSTGMGNIASSVVRLQGATSDFFVPADYHTLNVNDWDLNAGGPMLLPNTNLLLAGGKTGALFLLNRTNLGGLVTGNTQVVQTWQATAGCGSSKFDGCDEIHHYAYWPNAPEHPRLYLWAWNETLKAFNFNGATFDTKPVAQNAAVSNYPGGQLAVSSNAGKTGTGIVWAAMSTEDSSVGAVPGMLRAFDAVSLTELWNSNMNPADNAGLLAKFCLPTVTNGKVYLATFSNELNVYGLR
jgi:hypothetical protein